jgi:hypothetical protein
VSRISKLIECSLVISFFAMMLTMSIFTGQVHLAYAGGKSPYESGYDHGRDDADEDVDDRYINQPERGPSFHTDAFMRGYNAGFNDCSGGGGQPYQPPYNPPTRSGGINWENLCNQYGHLVGIKDPCNEYASGTQLTEKGRTALVCLLGGGITLLAGVDPATKAQIIALGQQYCP